MKEYILNTIVLKTGDSIEIVEPSTLPMKDRVMYKLQHEEDRVVIVRGNGKMVIPMDNIMFSSSIPLDIIHEDFDDSLILKLRSIRKYGIIRRVYFLAYPFDRAYSLLLLVG